MMPANKKYPNESPADFKKRMKAKKTKKSKKPKKPKKTVKKMAY